MENLKKAIIKAIEDGGYSPSDETNYEIDIDALGNVTLRYFSAEYPEEGSDEYSASEVALDKNFWSALGKAMGKDENKEARIATHYFEDSYSSPIEVTWNGGSWWWMTWHRFIDHLASGGTADDFFNELLK